MGGRKGLVNIGTVEYRVGEYRDWETKGLVNKGTVEDRNWGTSVRTTYYF